MLLTVIVEKINKMGPIKPGKKKASAIPTVDANDYKEQGNRFFSMRKYNEALSCYSKAISINPNISTFYTNRALCYLKLKQWQMVCQDSRIAAELDPCLVKAHFFIGQALLEMKLYDEAIASLMRANDLARDQKLNFGDDILSVLRLARKRKWMAAEERCIQEENELKSFLSRLINEEKNRQKEKIDPTTSNGAVTLDELESIYQSKQDQLSELFQKLEDKRTSRDVPDVLCGKISFELMKDPVITPSGITYDRRDIDEHLQRVGHFDPVTRSPLTQEQLVPNLAMKEVLENYLEENPWAEDF